MIYNRYVGIRKYFMRGKILRNALYEYFTLGDPPIHG